MIRVKLDVDIIHVYENEKLVGSIDLTMKRLRGEFSTYEQQPKFNYQNSTITLKEKIEEFSREAFDIDKEQIADSLDKLNVKELTYFESIAFCQGVEWICDNIVNLMEKYNIDVNI